MPGEARRTQSSQGAGGERFDGLKPHPNAVLNLFVQQGAGLALPVAHYMAARRGLDLLMDTRLPLNATLSGRTLRSAMHGPMALREMELKETHRVVLMINAVTNVFSGMSLSELEGGFGCWNY